MIITLGMFMGSLPFLLYLSAVRGSPGSLFRDSQVQWFVTVLALVIILVSGWLWMDSGLSPLRAVQLSSFNVVSIMTGTGYATAGFDTWGSLAVPVFFFIMFIGGCAGSTTCGIKVFRFQVLYAAAKKQFGNLAQPNGVFIHITTAANFRRRYKVRAPVFSLFLASPSRSWRWAWPCLALTS